MKTTQAQQYITSSVLMQWSQSIYLRATHDTFVYLVLHYNKNTLTVPVKITLLSFVNNRKGVSFCFRHFSGAIHMDILSLP